MNIIKCLIICLVIVLIIIGIYKLNTWTKENFSNALVDYKNMSDSDISMVVSALTAYKKDDIKKIYNLSRKPIIAVGGAPPGAAPKLNGPKISFNPSQFNNQYLKHLIKKKDGIDFVDHELLVPFLVRSNMNLTKEVDTLVKDMGKLQESVYKIQRKLD